MSHRRYSLGAALAATRGALTATNRAERRYAKSSAAWHIEVALGRLRFAEMHLRRAVADVLDERERQKTKARAA